MNAKLTNQKIHRNILDNDNEVGKLAEINTSSKVNN